MTDLQKFPDMAQQVIGAYVAIVLEGDFSARYKLIKRYWQLVGDDAIDLPSLIRDPVAASAFRDDTEASDPFEEHEGRPRTVREAFGEDPLAFDMALEIAASYALNFERELAERRDTLLPYPFQLRTLHFMETGSASPSSVPLESATTRSSEYSRSISVKPSNLSQRSTD